MCTYLGKLIQYGYKNSGAVTSFMLFVCLLLDVEVTIDTKLYTVKTKARNLRELNDSSIAGGSLQSLLVSGSQNTVDSDSIIFRQSSLE